MGHRIDSELATEENINPAQSANGTDHQDVEQSILH